MLYQKLTIELLCNVIMLLLGCYDKEQKEIILAKTVEIGREIERQIDEERKESEDIIKELEKELEKIK